MRAGARSSGISVLLLAVDIRHPTPSPTYARCPPPPKTRRELRPLTSCSSGAGDVKDALQMRRQHRPDRWSVTSVELVEGHQVLRDRPSQRDLAVRVAGDEPGLARIQAERLITDLRECPTGELARLRRTPVRPTCKCQARTSVFNDQ